MDLEDFIARATTARGFRLVKPDDLEALIPVLEKRGYWVTRLEAYEIRGEREITNLEHSIIGLDGAENWEDHGEIARHTALVHRKLAEVKASGLPIVFQVWIEEEE